MKIEFRDSLEIVVIDGPIHYLDNAFVRDIFSKIAQLKVAGFKTLESRYFAFGREDLVATHIMAGQYNERREFRPLIAYKAVSETQSAHWGLPFDGVDVVMQSGSKEHIQAILDYKEQMNRLGRKVGYQSSLTMCPRVKCRRQSVELVKILQSMAARYILDFDVSASICIAREKVKSAGLFERFGFKKIAKDGQALPTLTCPQYQNNDYFLMTFDELTGEGVDLIKEYQKHWDRRLEISARRQSQFHKDNLNRPGEHKSA